MERMRRALTVLVMIVCAALFAGSAQAEVSSSKKQSAKFDMKQVDRGRYLTIIGGCNDCHTPGYLLNEGKTPEKLWLTGDKFGWRGPWGTTYAVNLRTYVASLKEKQWLEAAKNIKTRPPMPWFALNVMHDEDLKAIYQFIRYLGPAGEPAPAYVPPDQEPNTPYALFPSPPKEGHN
jgi:mono/diheme cytochrome c family protein